MSIQVAFGGGINQFLLDNNGFILDLEEEDYLEPGFNIMFPLEFQVSSTLDTLYLVIRERMNTDATAFQSLNPTDFEVKVEDATTGATIEYELTNNTINTSWDKSLYSPLVLTINNVDNTIIGDTTCRVRAINIQLNNTVTNEFIIYRVLLLDDSLGFGYIASEMSNNANNLKDASFGSETLIETSREGSYVLLTPGSKFFETTRKFADFSYPTESIYYYLEKGFNAEMYDWRISEVSDPIIKDFATVNTVPQFPQVGLVRIDGYAFTALAPMKGKVYFDVEAVSQISKAKDKFRVYLKKISSLRNFNIFS